MCLSSQPLQYWSDPVQHDAIMDNHGGKQWDFADPLLRDCPCVDFGTNKLVCTVPHCKQVNVIL